MAPLRIRIVGERLPGKVVGANQNVHIGIQRGEDVVDLVPGDAPSAVFEIDVVRREDDGDYRGPYIHGKPGDRFLYLVWADVDPTTGETTRFSRVKLMLAAVPAGVVGKNTKVLEAYLPLTGADGKVVVASVRPPNVNWSSG